MEIPQLNLRSRRNSSEDEEKKADRMLAQLRKAGFSQNRCLKALAATGFSSERVAAEWLISHIDDELLDEDTPREYYIFLCPEGDLSSAVQDFWTAAQKLDDWNAAHEFPPHVTLVPPFEVPDKLALTVHKLLTNIINSFYERSAIQKLPLELYTNSDPSFIGYVVPGQVKALLEDFTNHMLADLQNAGIVIPAEVLAKRKGIYHLSLVYGFSPSKLPALSRLVENYLPTSLVKADCRWEIRMYSRDVRLCGVDAETYEMKMSSADAFYPNLVPSPFPNNHVVPVTDRHHQVQLVYQVGDHVALLDSCRTPPRHGWALGLNLNTGQTGQFPLASAERVPQCQAWVLHRSLPFGNSLPGSPSSLNGDCVFSPDTIALSGGGFGAGGAAPSSPTLLGAGCPRFSTGSITGSSQTGKLRRFFIIRHAERMDLCFGRNWIAKCFDQKGVYKRLNLNMPPSLPSRDHEDFTHDSPLTQVGLLVAAETGRSLAEAGVFFSHCYASPALRCVQTSCELLKGCGQADLSVRIEPYLFEWLGWYAGHLPRFMPPNELRAAGFNVEVDYKPLSSEADYQLRESVPQYYERTGKLVKKLADLHKKKGSCILIVGHAGSLDTCSRPLLGSGVGGGGTKSRHLVTVEEFQKRAGSVPYCGLVVVEERRRAAGGGSWALVDPPVPPCTYFQNPDFDWKKMLLTAS